MFWLLKRFLKYLFFLISGIAVLTAGLVVYLVWLQPAFYFPKPTGQYAVGTKLFEFTDSTRNDPETSKPRELVVQV